jgi:hypothetical protein
MINLRTIKYAMPAAVLGIGLTAVALAQSQSSRGSGGVSTDIKTSIDAPVTAEVSTDGQTAPSVTVNGQSVEVKPNSTTRIHGGGGTTTVTVSGSGSRQDSQTTQTVTSDGGVNISVSGNSTDGSKRSTVRYRGTTDIDVQSNSSSKVEVRGESSSN